MDLRTRLRRHFALHSVNLTLLAAGSCIGLVQLGLAQSALAQAAVEGRPLIGHSSAQSHASSLPDLSDGSNVQAVLSALGESQLDFFDDLERQPLVCHDDALHACLLLGAGVNATTFDQRIAMASQLGWITPTFDRPAREAATVGEVCRIAATMLDGRDARETLSVDQAVLRISQISPLPSTLKAYQGITGAQLLSVLSGVHDAILDAGSAAVPQPAPLQLAPIQPEPPRPISVESAVIQDVRPSPEPQPAPSPVAPTSVIVPQFETNTDTAPPQAGSSSVIISDVYPANGQPRSWEPMPDTPAPRQPAPALPERLELLPGAASPVEPSRQPLIPLQTAEPVAPKATTPVPAQPAPAQPAPEVVVPAQPEAETPAEPVKPARPSQYVPGKPIRRPSSR